MELRDEFGFVQRCFQRAFDARLAPGFGQYHSRLRNPCVGAALGFRRAGPEPLNLEIYLDLPIEQVVTAALAQPVERANIIEIGNFASTTSMAMIALWTACANDLGAGADYAVATLTAPLRSMFARLGVPVTVLAEARPERLGDSAAAWGSYYRQAPQVCVGRIADGQAALAHFAKRRRREAAA